MEHPFLMFLDHTQRRSTVGRTPLDEWSARRRDIYLTAHNTHKRPISMPPVGFEPTISAGERPQTYALDRAATGTGTFRVQGLKMAAESTSGMFTCFHHYTLSHTRRKKIHLHPLRILQLILAGVCLGKFDCLCWSSVTEVFHLKIEWTEVQLCFVRVR